MIDPKKFQPNPVVPKPKIPNTTVININPDYKIPIQANTNSKKIVVSNQATSKSSTSIKEDAPREKNTALLDFKKMINRSLEQSKNIFQNTTDTIKNVENKIQARFRNEIVKSDKKSEDKKNSKPKKEKEKPFQTPKSASKKIENSSSKKVKTKKHLISQLLVLTCCSIGVIGFATILLSFQEILGIFNADLKTIQWIAALFFLTSSVFAFYSNSLIEAWGSKKVLFDGVVLMLFGLLICIFSPNIFIFVFGASVIFAFGFAAILTISKSLFYYNSGYSDRHEADNLFSKCTVLAVIISLFVSGFLSYFVGFKITLGLDCVLALLAIFNLNRLYEIKDRTGELKIPFADIALFTVGNLFISFGIIESLRYGWFLAKSPLELFGQSVNPKISISLVSLLLGFFVLSFRNFVNKKSLTSLKPIFSTTLEFVKSGFLGGFVSLLVFGFLFFLALGNNTNLIQVTLGIFIVIIGLLISVFLVKNISQSVSSKNSKLLGLIIYIIGLIISYFTITVGVSLVNLISSFLLVGLGAGLFYFTGGLDSISKNIFTTQYSKFFSVIFFGLAFFWSFSSSNFNLTTIDPLIPENLKPDLFASINTTKELKACNIEPYNQNNLDELEARKIRRAICENFTNSIVEGSKTVITLAAVISVICFFVVISEKEKMIHA
jgi:MFS family permease